MRCVPIRPTNGTLRVRRSECIFRNGAQIVFEYGVFVEDPVTRNALEKMQRTHDSRERRLHGWRTIAGRQDDCRDAGRLQGCRS